MQTARYVINLSIKYRTLNPTPSELKIFQITHAMSSVAAALTAATMGTPADVIKTRIMNQPLDSNGKGEIK